MGWFGGKKKEQKESGAVVEQKKNGEGTLESGDNKTTTARGDLKGESVEVLRPQPTGPLPTDISVFEFGTVGTSEEKATLAGYCPVSDDMEPCRWELLPAGQAEAPGFRIIF